MALLSNTPSPRGRLYLGAALASLLVGCAILQQWLPGEKPFGFNHQVHVVQEEMECSDCHWQVEDADDPGIPAQAACMLCHEGIEPEDPARSIDQLFVDGQLPRTGGFGDDVIFSHLQHVEAYDCDACHAGVAESEHPSDVRPIGMADCTACHEQEGKPNDCSTCHVEIDTEWAPDSHRHNWTRRHGEVCRAGLDGAANDCSLCHTETACIQCHQTEAPSDHNNFWRMRSHGLVASLDRQRCATCHRSDFCVRCHEETEPLSHKGSFGGTQSNHCLSCHFPLQSSSCAVCHKATPSHLLATPLPPGHNPALDCRSCHPGLAPLPHADKGDACTICHM